LHKRGNGHPKKIGLARSHRLRQYICKDSSTTLHTLATRLSKDGEPVSHMTVGRRLKELGYKSGLPIGTPMLTVITRQNRLNRSGNTYMTIGK